MTSGTIDLGTKLYFDTTIFCEAFEGTSDRIALLGPILERCETRPLIVVTSDLTLAELLGRESAKGWAWQSRFYVDLLVHSGLVDLRPMSRDILIETGRFRQEAAAVGRRVKLADAVHAVTARQCGCQLVFTSDKRFFAPEPVAVVLSSESGVEAIKTALDA